MKPWLKIIISIFLVLAVLFLFMHLLVNATGKRLLCKKLEDTFLRQVSVESVGTAFPFDIRIRNLEVERLFKIEEVYASGGLLDIFRKNLSLPMLKVIRPVITVTQPAVAVAPDANQAAAVAPPVMKLPAIAPVTDLPPDSQPVASWQDWLPLLGFNIERLIILEGTFNFNDRNTGGKDTTVKINPFDITVDNLNFSGKGSRIISFELKGAIPWDSSGEHGTIMAKGWLNLFKKDIQMDLNIKDIDGISLYPYYSQWVDLEKARIIKAKLNFHSAIQGMDNDVTAECRLELTDMVFKPHSPEEKEEKAEKIALAVLDIFRSLNEGKIVLNFTVRTKMDRPDFGFSAIKAAFEERLAQGRQESTFKPQSLLLLPGKFVEEVVKTANTVSKAVIDGTFAVGKEVKKTVEQTVKKEKKEKSPEPPEAQKTE